MIYLYIDSGIYDDNSISIIIYLNLGPGGRKYIR